MLSLINYIFSLQLIVIDPKLSSSIRSYVIQGLNSNQIWPFTLFFSSVSVTDKMVDKTLNFFTDRLKVISHWKKSIYKVL